ncbi:hypothetical protein COY00_04665 [Candidatus Pacearchaeota archaeon CG_4_10_14_0_2_um_filter_35_33]|nr:MAG: hypothetical protein AUJ63_00665 [Candidatus Pacearchaeota archaeon CG1_02_35_32]PIY81543.1 MAG: hypothetical protein COY79_02280 [Candidatus Pacearchaeota archaeon CG_4_10_14_0_8_um_filter_35_169]PIZ78918.1 MAG: hypothetical protein COY00_04665 [Candidatus Pacearchaeota archaeon CG_4_10_14_0_2_um_filter_35_33]PJA69715.1 MAG: hypothetical protein CO155_03945 [Candidatus Pacearchaeota archaeon CG_4_9_14_3_um_filter_35_19]
MANKEMKRKKRSSSSSRKVKGLGLHVIPFSEVQYLSITDRIKKILKLILGNKIVILQGRLKVEEEIRLIEDTMAMVDHIKSFRGIELAVIEPSLNDSGIMAKMKQGIANRLSGNTGALTIIGPASIVKEIKKDPKKLEVMLG